METLRNHVQRVVPGGSRRNRGCSHVLLWVFAGLLFLAPIRAEAAEPLAIGVLAIGPRQVPVWPCNNVKQPEVANRGGNETEPFYVSGLRAELERLSYVEDRPENTGKPGRRFTLDVRMGNLQQLKTFARNFVDRRMDVIVAISTSVVRLAQEETRQHPIPILFPGISDPVGDGFVQSLARPAGFITGVSHQQVQGSGKRVELFKQMVPNLHRLITIHRPNYAPAQRSMEEIRETATRLDIEVVDWAVSNQEELQAKLAEIAPESADGIMILPDGFVIANLDRILQASLTRRIPTFGLQDFMADWGALAAYGPSAYQAGEHLARYIDKIRKGARPGDLPVEPIDPNLVINLKAAECLGILLPMTVLQQADRIIR